MSQNLAEIARLTLESVTADVVPPSTVRFEGTISMRSPTETLKPFLELVHRGAVEDGVEVLTVDITKLSFMNSSSIRLLITWLDWINLEPAEKRYILDFRTNSSATWQQTTLSVLKSLGADTVRISRDG